MIIRPSNLINKYLEMSAEDKSMFDNMYSLIKNKKHRDEGKTLLKLLKKSKTKKMINKSLTIKDNKYIILEEDYTNGYRKIYILEDKNKIIHRLLIEDYRNASFMYDKFYTAVINQRGDGRLKTVNVEDIKIIKQR